MNKTMVQFLTEEMNKLNGMVYFSKPYPCCYDECITYFKKWDMPDPKRMTIERTEKEITISIKPLKGSGKRKLYVIQLWVS